MTTGVTVRKKKAKRWREPRQTNEIQYEYITQLWAELERLQDEDDEEMTTFLTTAERTESADEVYWSYAERKEFFNEMFDAGECALISNMFLFRMPKHFACTTRLLKIFNIPDVCWAYAAVNIGVKDIIREHGDDLFDLKGWDDHLVITVMLIDG
jgi:hypothetical protein